MNKKAILAIFDGLGDWPVAEFGGKTPLEAATTPNLDALAAESITGMLCSVGRGIAPGSDIAHLSLFGYAPETYYGGRGPIEASGVGIKLMGGDIAFRANLSTVGDNLEIIDRRAGRIEDVSELTKALDGMMVDDVECIVKPGTAYRAVLVLRGKDLSEKISDIDPHGTESGLTDCKALTPEPNAVRTATILNKFTKEAHKILSSHPLNEQRIKQGQPAANYLLTRGAGKYSQVPSIEEKWHFKTACVAGGGLYKGIGAFLGMDVIPVEGANALASTNIEAKFKKAIELLNTYDFVFVHVKASDSLGEDGNFNGKKDFIEKIDKAAALFRDISKDTLLVITGDHSTPCYRKAHSSDPVPIMFRGKNVLVDNITSFGERACAQGGMGIIEGRLF